MKTNNINIEKKESNRKSTIFKFSNFQIVTFLLFYTVLLFTSCKQNNEQAKKPKAKKAPLVEVQSAQKTNMVSYIDITGTIEPNVFTQIKSPADGTINSLSARENQHVRKNQIVAVINPTDREALISENRLQVQQIENQLKTADENSEEYKTLSEKLEKAKSNLEYAKNMYQVISVVSPMSGLVTERLLDQGSQVGAGEKILTISNMNSLVIKASANEKYFQAIEQGKKLPIILNAYPNDTLSGRISLVYPQVDPATRNIKFDIKILNFNKKLLPGMMASVKISHSENENAVAVPEQAVLTSPNGENFLFVVTKDSLALRKRVQTGISSGNKLEIINGLKENEKVVVAGQEMLKDSVKVKIMKL